MAPERTASRRRARGALAAALLTSALLTSCTGDDDGAGRPGAEPSASVATPTADPVPVLGELAAPTVVRIRDLAVGERPGIRYVYGDEVVSPDGRRVTLERPTVRGATGSAPTGLGYTALARYADGWLGTSSDGGRDVTTLHRPDGRFVRYPSLPGPVSVSRDGRWALMGVDAKRDIVLVGPRDEQVRWPASFHAEPVGFVGRRAIAFNVSERTTSDPVRVRVASRDGTIRTLPGLRRIAATSERGHLVSGTRSRGLHAPADTVVDVRTGEEVLLARGVDLIRFSPDGSLVVGRSRVSDVRDQFGRRRLIVASVATGEVLVHLELASAPREVVWEDDRHLLVHYDTSAGRVSAHRYFLRVDRRGRVEVALRLPPQDGEFDLLTLTTSPD
jgi:hypothetical protein